MVMAMAFFAVSELASMAISFLLPSKGPRLTDLSVSASTYGNVIPTVFGTCRVAGNMIWSLPITETKSKVKAGMGQFQEQYTYYGNFAMAFCQGPAQQVLRIWAGGWLIYDATGESEYVTNGTYSMTFYSGSEDQMPDPSIEADVGTGVTEAYRGLCYIVFENFNLTQYGNVIPPISAEIVAWTDNAIQTPITNLVYLDPPVLTGDALGQTVLDPIRGYYYMTSSSTTPTGIRQFDLSTDTEVRDVESAQMQIPQDPPNEFGTQYDDGQFTSLLGVDSQGDILCVTGGVNNFMRICRLDPNSFEVNSFIGHSNPFAFTPPILSFPVTVQPALFDVTGLYFLTISLESGDAWVFKSDPNLGLLGSSTFAVEGQGDGGATAFCGADTGVFYYAASPEFGNPQQLPLYSVTCSDNGLETSSVMTQVATIEIPLSGATGFRIDWLAYDSGNAGVLIFCTCNGGDDSFLLKWSPETEEIVWSLPLPDGYPIDQFRAQNIFNATIAWVAGTPSKLWVVDTTQGVFADLSPGQVIINEAETNVSIWSWLLGPNEKPLTATQTSNPGDAGYSIPATVPSGDLIYDGNRGVLACNGANDTQDNCIVNVGSYSAETITLDLIVEYHLRVSGLLGMQFELTALEDIVVDGFGFAATSDVKSIINELKSLYQFDLVESNNTLVAVLRGGTEATATINYLALAAQDGDNPDTSKYWEETRTNEADLPGQISLVYNNIDNDYQPSTALSKRIYNPVPTMFSQQKVQFQSNVIFNADTAQQQVAIMLRQQWGERVQHKTKLPWAYLYLDPADLISVNLANGTNAFERITKIDIGADYTVNTDSASSDAGVYVNLGQEAQGGGAGRTQTVSSNKPATAVIFNTPYLRDTDTAYDQKASIYYYGAAAISPTGFNGAVMFSSTDDVNFSEFGTQGRSVEWGAVSGVVPDTTCGVYGYDRVTQIKIWPAVSGFTLESVTDDALVAGANPFVVGSEVMQFRDAVENDDGSWTISTLLRGRRGTEWATGSHQLGESAYFLDTATVQVSNEPTTFNGTDVFFSAVGPGLTLQTSKTTEVTYYPRDLMPYAPTDIRRSISGNPGDITIWWSRRTRYNGNLADGTGAVPLNETEEAYVVYLLNAPFAGDPSTPVPPTSFVRMLTWSGTYNSDGNPQITYSEADQSTDSFDNGTDTLHVVVYQLSGIIGRGFPGSRDIAPWRIS